MTALALLADLVLARRCGGCGTAGRPLCPACTPSSVPLPVRAGELEVAAAGWYHGPLRAAVLRYKERGRRDLAAPLGALLARAVLHLLAGNGPPARLVLVPVPSSRAAAAARGGDHVARLARRCAPRCGVPVGRGVLAPVRSVADSAGLTGAERAANLAGAFRARRAPPGWSALVVDDVVTTGATLGEARRALLEAGWDVLGGAVVAATRLRRAQAARAVTGQPPGTCR